MVTGLVRKAQEAGDTRKVRIEYEKGRPRWCPLWDNNPRIAHYTEVGDFQILKPRDNYLRPYCAEKTPTRWRWKEYRPPVGEIYLQQYEKGFAQLNAGYIVFGPFLKPGAPACKDWGWDRWQELARLVAPFGKVATIGPIPPRRLSGNHIETNIRQAAAVISTARLVVTHEGALHHIAAAFGTPAVVIYGGYISPKVTGYEGQIGLFHGDGLGCGSRGRCAHCDDAMGAIRPQHVADQISWLLEWHTKTATAPAG